MPKKHHTAEGASNGDLFITQFMIALVVVIAAVAVIIIVKKSKKTM